MDLLINKLPKSSTKKETWPWIEPAESNIRPTANTTSLPKISIVTPSFNQGQFIEETIRSVLLQEYPNSEYIIIDGGSTDQTVDIIKKYEPWLTYWESKKDNGQSHAINKGLRHATGDYVAYLNSDDIYLPGALHAVAQAAHGSGIRQDWVAGNVQFCDPHLKLGRLVEQKDVDSIWTWISMAKKYRTPLCQPSVFWSREICERVGRFDEKMHYAFDSEYWVRTAICGYRPHLISKTLSLFRLHDTSKTIVSQEFGREFQAIALRHGKSASWPWRLIWCKWMCENISQKLQNTTVNSVGKEYRLKSLLRFTKSLLIAPWRILSRPSLGCLRRIIF